MIRTEVQMGRLAMNDDNIECSLTIDPKYRDWQLQHLYAVYRLCLQYKYKTARKQAC